MKKILDGPFFLIAACVLSCAAVLLAAGRPRDNGARPHAGRGEWSQAASPEIGRLHLDLAANPPLTNAQRDALLKALRAASASANPSAAVKIDYPFAGSLFPPDMVPPAFLFHDGAAASRLWFVDIAGETGRVSVLTDGRRPKPDIDERCGIPEGYQEPEYQASARSWTPDAEIWESLVRQPEKDIAVTIYGLAGDELPKPGAGISLLSRGTVVLRISGDPVGAPIFYRDVPLKPTTNERGVVMPLPEGSLPLVEWRLRDLSKPASTLVLKDMPTCANCHSFSNDGKFLGMDMDGPSGDKGSYAVAPIEPRMVIGNKQVFTWNSFNPKWPTNGLFARVSPDGRYVITSVNESMFVTNYLDFRFLQTFYPTRGILAFRERATGKIATLPGADDPRFVQCNPVWTPDGRTIVFLRAPAMDPALKGPGPQKALDPNEPQIKYDICTIPFNDGRGGEAKPLPGASANGKSNSFPKVSPDGRWIVWVQSANALLMRPDSELYIMPLAGGALRRMNCNLSPMNSWHSFSPNSRWLVFSSKAETPFTRMFLTHIDEKGNDSPAVLVPNATAANRAVNIPEFVNIAPGGLVSIDAPAVDYRRHLVRAADLTKKKDLAGAFKELRIADEMRPDFPDTLAAIGYYYRETGDTARAVEYFEKALAIDPRNWPAHNFYGATLFRQGKYDEALRHFQAAMESNPFNSQGLTNIGVIEFARGNLGKAKEYLERAVESDPRYAKAHFNLALIEAREGRPREAVRHYESCLAVTPDDPMALGNLAWLYATSPDDGVRNGPRALELAQKLEKLVGTPSARMFDILAAACAETGRFAEAVRMAERALALTRDDDPSVEIRRRLVELYGAGKPYRAF
jgi:Tfp pilus assembly protein PilF